MPTYLTPGVYVEEVPSANKPIEGVSTSIAAFVGLAPGGPVNTPMRISNWTQFAKIYGDPNEPDNGPFMEGAYLAHSVYGFFQNGGNLCWIVRVGDDGGSNGSAAAARAALPAAADASVETYGAVALGAGSEVEVEIAEEPSAGEGADKTFTVRVTSGADKEEFTGLTTKKGRNNLATKVNAQSKLIKIEETGASLPEAQRAPATGTFKLSAPSIDPSKVKPTHFEGDVARRKGMGGLAAVDEVTMVVMPDIMTLAQDNGDDVQIRDLQGKMIAHCEMAGDRMAILDCPPDMLPQEILEWRMNTAGYDSKFAALYYPWIEVQDPLTNQPIMVPPSGHVAGLWCRTDSTRGVHKAPANEVVPRRQRPRLPDHAGGAGRPQQGRHQLHPRLPGPRHPRVGRPHDVERPRMALHQRPEALQLRLRVDHGGHAVERVRAQRREAVDPASDRGDELPHPRVERRGAVRLHARAGVLRQVRLRDQPARSHRGRPGHL